MNARSIADPASARQPLLPPDISIDRLVDSGPREAIEHLKSLDAGGWHHLDALEPESGRWEGYTFPPNSWADIESWVRERIVTHNLYYAVNEPESSAPNKKLSKSDIANIRCVCADLDPSKEAGAEFAAEQSRLDELIEQNAMGMWPASHVIHSGNGRQLLWALKEKLPATEHQDWAESQGRAIADALGGDRVQNIDRILRLPGTLNIPTATKVRLGRAIRRSSIARLASYRYEPRELSKYVPAQSATSEEHLEHVREARAELEAADLFEVPPELATRFAEARLRCPQLNSLWRGDKEGLFGSDVTGSGFRASLARHMAEMGFDCVDYGRIVLSWGIPEIDCDKIDPDTEPGLRQLSRDWGRFGRPHSVAQWLDNASDAEPLFPDEPAKLAKADANIEWVDPRAWRDQPVPDQEWEAAGLIPRGEVTVLYGDGGIGKTLVAHQYAICATAGTQWLGLETRQSRVLCFFCEDHTTVLMRRHRDLIASLGLNYDATGDRLKMVSRRGDDNLLAYWDRSTNRMNLTDVWHALRRDALAFAADVIIIDTIADVFGGNELDRAQVNGFVKGCLGRLADDIGGSVIALGHPSRAGIADGSGTSGSTHWNNAVRSRLYLRYPKSVSKGDIRELEAMKSNYGPKGTLLKLAWRRGAFEVLAGTIPRTSPSSVEFPSLDDAAERAVVAALMECDGVRMSPGKTSSYFAPRVLRARVPDILGSLSEDEIGDALERLQRRGAVRHDTVGRDASRRPVQGYVVIADKLSEQPAASGSAID